MDIIKLKYFHIVAKYQHVTQASDELHIAQPALTKAIKLLEEELGVALFYKKGRNIKLTEYGQFLKTKLDVLIPEFDALPQKINTLKSKVENQVRLNVLAASNLVTEAVVEYRKKRADVIFELIQSAEETCDISVLTTAKKHFEAEEGDKVKILDEELFLAVPKQSVYANKKTIELSEVKNESFVSLGGSKQLRAICNGFCSIAGFIPKTTFESDSALAVKRVIASKTGVGFWPEYSWGKAGYAGVSILPISAPKCNRKIIIVRHDNGNLVNKVDDFYDFLCAFIEKRKLNSELNRK